MDKVYLVKEVYNFENEINAIVNVYDSKEKAICAFNRIVKEEKEKSWIADIDNREDSDYEFEENFTSLYCYDYNEGNSTYIVVQEKEVL